MNIEKRNHHRHKPKNLQAGVTITTSDQEITLDADILDISLSGIRVKLKEAIASMINGRIKITMILPESGTPFAVHGILKHEHNEQECGVKFVNHVEGSIDDLMFECIELDKSTLLIKTL